MDKIPEPHLNLLKLSDYFMYHQWRTSGGGMFSTPLEIPKAHQNRAKLNPIVKT